MQFFVDRADAGRQLAEALGEYADNTSAIVLALPRGGVPVAYEVGRQLHIALDVYVVRKLGVPGHEELAMGAVASDATSVLDEDLIASLAIDSTTLEQVVQREIEEVRRRDNAYRGTRAEPHLEGKIVIIIDDGLATGSTMRAAALALRRRNPAVIIAAVPVAARRTCSALRNVVDRVVCVHTPEPFHAVGLYYHNFEQTSDHEVGRLLAQADAERTGRGMSA